MFESVPILPQELHHPLVVIQHAEKRDTLLALSFVNMLHESRGAHFAEFWASWRNHIWRTTRYHRLSMMLAYFPWKSRNFTMSSNGTSVTSVGTSSRRSPSLRTFGNVFSCSMIYGCRR